MHELQNTSISVVKSIESIIGHLFMSTLIVPVAREMFVCEVPVGVFKGGLQDVAVASVLLLDVILLSSVLDLAQD